jgi:hypothetical protein
MTSTDTPNGIVTPTTPSTPATDWDARFHALREQLLAEGLDDATAASVAERQVIALDGDRPPEPVAVPDEPTLTDRIGQLIPATWLTSVAVSLASLLISLVVMLALGGTMALLALLTHAGR